eukprot:c5232_g1_i1.p1 GENE.c5232_g1_i1~~c5232_g1_i1.p1  ORF type:complete len:774 (-),score=157.49 c5232_g1_i1:41-2362(-)
MGEHLDMSRVVPLLNLKPGDLAWDFVFVIPADANEQRIDECYRAINRMKQVGLQIGQMHGSHGDTLVLVTSTLERLQEEADRRGIEMKLKDEYKDKLTGSAGYSDFCLARKHMFAGNDLPRFFTSLERQRLIVDILEAPKSENGCELDYDKLKITFSMITPLHDDDARENLMKKWVKGGWTQPLNEVRDYFGEKIAMYFSFLGHYTLWLFFLSIFGLIAQIIQVVHHDADHPIVPFYCLFLTLWTTFFLESWKRQQSVNAFLWDVQDFEEEEKVRPEYVGFTSRGIWVGDHFINENELSDDPNFDPEELVETKYFPSSKRWLRYLISMPVIGVFIVCTVAGTTGILVFRGLIAMPYPDGMGRTGQVLGGMVNAMFITFMNIVYKKVATVLNNFENHRTDTAYEDALIGKVFLFQFVNSYISLFYIAFVKQFQVKLFGMESGTCRNSCLDEMATQLLSLVVIMQIVGNFKELLIPYMIAKVKVILARRKAKKTGNTAPAEAVKITKYEDQAQMPAYLSTFDDYNEMAIQFGYVTMFAAAFPVASFASLINNVIEIRSDAFKLLKQTQRPRYVGCEDIGSWQKVFEVISTISVIANVCIIGFTSLVLSGKCEWKADFPHGCDGTECEFFQYDAFRASPHASTIHIGTHEFSIDCTVGEHVNSRMCCPVVLDGQTNIVHEVTSTLFLTPFQVLIVVVLCEHAILLIRALLEEMINDVPGWVKKAQARLDIKKEHLAAVAQGLKTERSSRALPEKWTDDERKDTVFLEPSESDMVPS